ncbi:putative RNA-directed DNA polymerase from transposon BS, partial [Frankliniella fusca]
GSALAPLLFTLYIVDITNVLHFCNIHLYADDIQLYIHFEPNAIDEAVKLINLDVSAITNYLNNHGLYVNATKTQPIILGSNKFVNQRCLDVTPKIIIDDQEVAYCRSVKNLGLTIDCTLTWKEQVQLSVNRVFASLAQAKRNISCMPLAIRKKLVQAIIMPTLEYCLSVMTNISEENMNTLQKAQNACIRFIFKTRWDEHITPYFIELNWLKVRDRQRIAILNLIWKTVKFKNPAYLYEMLTFAEEERNRMLRSDNNCLRVPVHRTEMYDRSFCVVATRIFNEYGLQKTLHKATNQFGKKQAVKTMLKSY